MLPRLAHFFDLSIVRARALVRSALFFFLFVAGVTALKSGSNALFLARRDPKELPYLYLATAFAITVVTVEIGKRLLHRGAKPVLRRTLQISGATLLILGLLAALDFRPALPVLYVAGEVYATAVSVLFWARLGEAFDVRSAKRIYGAIGGAGMSGAVLGGLGVSVLSRSVPSELWCFFAAATTFLMAPLLGRDRGRTAMHQKKISFAEGLSYTAFEPFPRGVALLVLLLSVQTAAVDYVFRTGAVQAEQGSEAALASMFGVLNAVVGVGSLLVQVLLTAPLLRQFGLFAFLSILPVTMIVCAGWSVFTPGAFLPLFFLKTLEMMGSLSLNQPGLQLLYNPMPTRMRDSVRALVDGAVKKLGGATGGVLLIMLGTVMGRAEQLAVVVGLALIILLWIRALKPGYLDALESKLGARGFPIPQIDPSDRATREELLRALASPEARKVLAAVSVLSQDRSFDLAPHVADMIAHSSEAVRLKAIELIMSAPNPAYGPLLVAVLQNDARRPKAQAARALQLVDPALARQVLEPILHDPGRHDLGLVSSAVAALMAPEGGGHAPSPSAQRALETLLTKGRSGTVPERREIARLLGLLGRGPHARHLALYLDDPEPSVRVIAVESAAQALDPGLPPRLVPRLLDRRTQRGVRSALAAYGNSVVELLRATLDDRRLPLELRVNVPRILRQIGTQSAADAMLFSNVHDDAFLRYVIVEELSRMRRTSPRVRMDKRRVHDAVIRRLRSYRHYRPIARDLANAPPVFALLRRAVEDRVRQNLELAIRVLGLVYDADAMENACRGLLAEGPARADALELIDVTLQGSEIRGEVLADLEAGDHGVAPRLPPIDRAHALVEGRDMQLAMIAWETLSRIGEDPGDVREPSVGESVMPKSIVDRVFLIQNVQLFQGLAVDDLAAVAALTEEGHAPPGQIVYLQGDPGDSMYMIISGEVRLLRQGQLLMELTQGDSFGQTSILDRGPRPVTAQAGDEGVDYLVLERAPFMDLLADRPLIMNGLFIVLARRLRELVDLTRADPSDDPSALPTLTLPAGDGRQVSPA